MSKKFKNVIIISIDALRADCIAANPHKELLEKFHLKTKLKTPILDWFLKNGTFFSNCITAAPYTTASHASILTGQWPNTHKLQHFFRNKLESKTLFEILKEKGFLTLSRVDFRIILGPMLGFTKSVDFFAKKSDEESLKWISMHADKPKLCFFHFGNVHTPYGFSTDLKKNKKESADFAGLLYKLAKKYEVPLNGNTKRNNPLYSKRRSEFDNVLNSAYGKILSKLHQAGLYGEIMELYIKGINYFEKNRLDKFINGLKKLGIFENSLVVILSDHGELWSEESKGHFGPKCIGHALRDDIIKVPLIFFGKNIPKGLVVESQVRTIDVVPTILSLLDIDQESETFNGKNLAPFTKTRSCRPAYSQVWKAEDDSEAHTFRESVNLKRRMPEKTFQNYLMQDSYRVANKKIIRYFDLKGKVVDIKYFNLNNGEKELANKKEAWRENFFLEADAFKKKIDRKRKRVRISPVDQERIKRELSSLGY
jgi:choline-sulfatase